jgi:hypothetical protein
LVDAGIYRDMDIALKRVLRVGAYKTALRSRKGWGHDVDSWELAEPRTPYEVSLNADQLILLSGVSKAYDVPESEAAVIALLQGQREEEYCPIVEVADELLSSLRGDTPSGSVSGNGREFHFFLCLCNGDTRCAEILIEWFYGLGIHGLCQTYIENGGVCTYRESCAPAEHHCRTLSTIYHRLPKRIRDRRL